MDSIDLLKKFGFTEYEARAYLSLVKLGPSSVGKIIQNSKLPRNKAYEALQKLEERGRVVSIPVSPKKYKVVDPEIFNAEIDDMKKGVGELVKLAEQPGEDGKEFFWVTKGREAIHKKFVLHDLEIEKELLICHKVSKSYSKNIYSMKECVKRGISVKILAPHFERDSDVYRELVRAGVKIRTYDDKVLGQQMRFSVHDGIRASVTIGSPETKSYDDCTMLWTESSIFANMLRTYFMSLWERSED